MRQGSRSRGAAAATAIQWRVQVEKILGMRSSKKFGVEYQIQWKGGRKKETSWEPEANVMDDDLVRPRAPRP